MTLHHQEARHLPRQSNPPTRRPTKDPGVYECQSCHYVGDTRSQALPAECPRCKHTGLEWLLR